VDAFTFYRAVDRLADLALLDVQPPDINSAPRYALHPLVQTFASAKLRDVPNFDLDARKYYGNYFVKFATRYIVRDKPEQSYWNALAGRDPNPIDTEWSNFLNVLIWAHQNKENQTLVDLMVLLVHYMDRHALNPLRIQYAPKAAEAANQLGRKVEEAWLRIDALGWTLTEEGRFVDAEREIMRGLNIGKELGIDCADANDIMALSYGLLAKVNLYQENLAKALECIEMALALDCRPVIRYRINMIAGEVEHKHHRYQEAITLYKEAARLAQQYEGEEQGADELSFRLGFVYLAQRDLAQAEAMFRGISSIKSRRDTLETIYGKYGLACVAQANGEIIYARQLAEDALVTVSRFRVGHRLQKEIKDFLASLEAH
jgi:tetratricopeptide (TPR) repeat protein